MENSVKAICLATISCAFFLWGSHHNQQLYAKTAPSVAALQSSSVLKARGPFRSQPTVGYLSETLQVAEHPAAFTGTNEARSIRGVATVISAAILMILAAVWKITRSKGSALPQWSAAAIDLDDDYPGPGNPDAEYKIRVVWDNQEHEVKIRGNQSILMACEEAGLVVPYSCRHGVCLDCTAQIVEGREFARKDSQCHNAENIAAGYVCTCSTYAGGDGLKLMMGMKDEAYKAQFGKFEEEERQREEKKKKGLFGNF